MMHRHSKAICLEYSSNVTMYYLCTSSTINQLMLLHFACILTLAKKYSIEYKKVIWKCMRICMYKIFPCTGGRYCIAPGVKIGLFEMHSSAPTNFGNIEFS